MEELKPLDADETETWREFAKTLVTAQRALENDLQRGAGLSIPEYFVLMRLSEAPGGEAPLAEITGQVGLSRSRITRLVDELVASGHVSKRRSDGDGRASIVGLTWSGRRRLGEAYPVHLASVRHRLIDLLSRDELRALSGALAKVNAAIVASAAASRQPDGRVPDGWRPEGWVSDG